MTSSVEDIQQAYESWTKTSKKLMEPAREYMPGGDTRTTAHYAPYPAFMTRGEGCRLWDADGHEYIDFMNNFTSLILGHANPKVVSAVNEQISVGTAFAAPTESQVLLAKMIIDRVPSIEQIRFCSCGSEGTMMAARAARAFTGKQKIMKMEGGYNGNHDLGEISLIPIPPDAGPIEEPNTLPPDKGIALSSVADVVTVPFNEPEITEKLIKKHKDEVCALLMEPMLGGLGMIPPKPDYLKAIRQMTEDNDILLILDEVITFRLAPGGIQEIFDIKPDLTAIGKIIGGGLPIGAYGGRREIMQLFNPETEGFMWHASTFSGNPLSMAAGIAAVEQLEPDVYDRLNTLGDRLRDGLNLVFEKAGIRGQAIGFGSLVNVHFTDKPISNARDSVEGFFGAGAMPMYFHLCMLRRGIFPASRHMYSISTPMTDNEIDTALGAFAESLYEMKPIVEREYPHLLR
ncbi:MAG: aspartate aminotransferase family protein [Deltaproteobacteria bacterium]|nr:aspartate aminotransferase family protein [Deltaproteobacteria bacterium]